jgi:uncharacterized membrane protein YkvA (DUF1232 family)
MAVATARRMTAARALWGAFRGTSDVRAVPRLLRASATGRYRGVSGSRMALMALAVAYLVSPVDLMPELVLTVFGLGDDALVAAWLAGTLLSETEAFVRWERSTRDVVRGEVR